MQIKRKEEIIQADVLIIGGGISGLQAAIAAAEKGCNVVIAEKGDTRRSGCGATGNDHFMCYIPEYHGDDFDEILGEVCETVVGPRQDMNLLSTLMKRSFEMVQKWESYGINMRPTGDWNFEGHAMPERRRYHLKYDGANQKAMLTKKALSLGVKIYNKTPITEIISKDNRAIGAIGLNIKYDEPEMVIFQAKTIIIVTGITTRLYPGINPAYVCNTSLNPADAGGLAIAYRAGARMVNLDVVAGVAGPMQFARAGKGTWIGVLSYPDGKPVGPFVTKPTRELGDVTSDIWLGVFDQKIDDGTGPVYMNCSVISDEDLKHMHESFVSEGDTSINDYFDQFGIDLKKHMIEFAGYECVLGGDSGIDIDVNGETSLRGLFASGDVVGNVRGDITSAAVFGQIAGENAAERCLSGEEDAFLTDDRAYIETLPLVEEKRALYEAILNRPAGANWMEVNSTLQQIMNRYVSIRKIRSATLLQAGYKYLQDLKNYALEQLKANNAHELIRSLEVLDLLDTGMLLALCGENRKETRGNHRRVDYPFTNPLFGNKFQTIRLEEGKPLMEFRPRIRKID